MPTRISGRSFRAKVTNLRGNVTSPIKLNTKCKTLKSVSQTPSINGLFEKEKLLSNKKIISANADTDGALESSRAILNSLGISAISENQDANYSITNGEGLNLKNLETLSKTQDNNPNRIQENKFAKLKTKKIKSSDIYQVEVTNRIFEPDDCMPISARARPKREINTIILTERLLGSIVTPTLPGGGGSVGMFTDTSLIQDSDLRRDFNVQTTGTGRGTTGAQGDGRGGVDNAFGSGVTNRGSAY